MQNQLLLVLVFFIGFLLILYLAEILFRKLRMKAENTRMIVHFTAITTTLSFPYVFIDHWYVLILSVVFTIIIIASARTNYLNSVNGISRKTIGGVLFPLTVYFTFLVSFKTESKYLFVLPMAIMAISDPLAAYTGMNFKKFNCEIAIHAILLKKTILGSIAFLISSFIISFVLLGLFMKNYDLKTLILSVSISLSATIGELLSPVGTDTVTIPLVVVLMLIFFY